jgi:hypothetical protein
MITLFSSAFWGQQFLLPACGACQSADGMESGESMNAIHAGIRAGKANRKKVEEGRLLLDFTAQKE